MLTEEDRREVMSKAIFICDDLCNILMCANDNPCADVALFHRAAANLASESLVLYHEALGMEWTDHYGG